MSTSISHIFDKSRNCGQTPGTMHPELLKAAIRIRGYRLQDVARAAGVSPSAVSLVVHNKRRSVRVARKICEIARLDPEKVWPGRYPEFRICPIDSLANLEGA